MNNENKKRKPWINWLLFIGTAVVVFLLGLFASSIVERRSETMFTMQMVKDIPKNETRNSVWGANFPRQYETYMQNLDTNFLSKYNGSAKIDYLERYPELVIMWAGYGFSKDYLQGRGHAYAVQDIRETFRTGGVEDSPMPATCWTCKSPDVPIQMEKMGVAEFYEGKWKDKGHLITNPIGCMDCHNNETMELEVKRPAIVEAFERQGKDMSEFSRNEMRSMVCGQCHVEYYFEGEGKYLKFPWDNGFSADDMEEYYDNINFVDWTHKLSKTPMLKAQHPDFELFNTSVHAKRGVSCADCHMPYKTEGGVKFTDHHVTSPLENIDRSCAVCHRENAEELVEDVYNRQDKIQELRRIAEKSLAKAHLEAKVAWDNGATEKEMESVLTFIRHAQWRWDWVAAANGMGFHSPAEALRVLGTSIEKAEKAQKELAVILTKKGIEYPPELPDYSTKAKAQVVAGLDMEKIRKDKEVFMKTVVPVWDSLARERQGGLDEYSLEK